MKRTLRIFLTVFFGLFASTAMARGNSTLVIDNERSDRIQVEVDHVQLGEIRGEAQRSFRLSTGRHDIQIRDREGRLLRDVTMSVTPSRTGRMVIAETRGQLIVENPTGVALSLRVDGQDRGSLAAGEMRSFRLDQGSHRVEASYEVLGRKLELEDRGVRIEAEEVRRVRLEAPSFGLVQVQNRTGRTATLYIDGERHHMMDSGDISVLELPLGTARVSLKIRQRIVDQGQVDVKPFRAAVFEAEPATATLELDSDIPVRGEVYVDSMRVGNLDAHGRMRLSLRPGTHRLQVRDPAGRLLLDRRIQVDIFDTVRLRVQSSSVANNSASSSHIRPGSGPNGAVYVVD